MVNESPSVRSLFEEAVELNPADRSAFLNTACAGRAELRAELEALLRAHGDVGSFLGEPALADRNATLDWHSSDLDDAPESAGAVVGPYKLLECLGEGGFGVVFLAEQEKPVRRKVALKVIKPGMDTRQVVARFEAERQALALMDHTNIAKVLDAGATNNGRPYFVMELVHGVPITEYCDNCNLTTRERLELFIQVCRAVQHAHQKGVIHRDIKPTNVLVAIEDGKATPKIIDFGVAKAIGERLTEQTLTVGFAQMIGTPLYMSPEQAELSPLGVDTRSDIYSLGVLLYELLTGSTPFEKHRLREASHDELRRVIREEEPPWPSARISTLAVDLAETVAQQRRTDARRLRSQVQGELDWIVMKCLEKDRNRRYETAEALSNDIERHLKCVPIEARPSTRLYRIRKFIRRNKLGVFATTVIVSALAAGLAISSAGLIQARRQTALARSEASRADREAHNSQIQAARSEEVSQFLQDMLAAAGPSVALGRDTTLLREILDNTGKRLATDLEMQPAVQADLWSTLGHTYGSLGDNARAVHALEQAVERYRTAYGDESNDLALALSWLGDWQSTSGNVADGTENAKRGLEMARNIGDKRTIVQCLEYYAGSFDGYRTTEESIPFYREALAIAREIGMSSTYQARLMRRLGLCLGSNSHNREESELLLRQALAINRQHYPPAHPMVISSLYSLTQVLRERSNVEEAEEAAQEAFTLARRVYPPEAPLPSLLAAELHTILVHRGKLEQAREVRQQFIEFAPLNANSWSLAGGAHATAGDLDAAVEHFSRAAELTPKDSTVSWNLSMALLAAGRIAQYRENCHRVLQRDANTREFQVADVAAKAALLLPVDGTDFEEACRLADFAGTCTEPRSLRPYMELVKALAEYRRHRFESAIDWADRAIVAPMASFQCRAAAICIQACCYAKQQKWDLAVAQLSKADELIIDGQDTTDGKYDLLWRDWAAVEHLRREADDLLREQTLRTD